MITYKNDNINVNETLAKYDDIGTVTIDDLDGTFNFYMFTLEGRPLTRDDKKICDGSCL